MFLERLLASPSLSLLGPTERHAATVTELLAGPVGGSSGLAGIDLAAVLREHGVRELLSADRGMRRFGFLAVRDPVHGEPWVAAAGPLRKYRALRRRSE